MIFLNMDWLDWRTWVDSLAITLGVSSVFDFLPPLAAALSILWLIIRIYQEPAVQGLLPKSLRLPRPKYRDDPD